jgi:hypothetical protein
MEKRLQTEFHPSQKIISKSLRGIHFRFISLNVLY